MNKKNIILIAVLVIIIGIFAYFYFQIKSIPQEGAFIPSEIKLREPTTSIEQKSETTNLVGTPEEENLRPEEEGELVEDFLKLTETNMVRGYTTNLRRDNLYFFFDEKSNKLYLANLNTGEKIPVFEKNNLYLGGFALSPNGQNLILSAIYDQASDYFEFTETKSGEIATLVFNITTGEYIDLGPEIKDVFWLDNDNFVYKKIGAGIYKINLYTPIPKLVYKYASARNDKYVVVGNNLILVQVTENQNTPVEVIKLSTGQKISLGNYTDFKDLKLVNSDTLLINAQDKIFINLDNFTVRRKLILSASEYLSIIDDLILILDIDKGNNFAKLYVYDLVSGTKKLAAQFSNFLVKQPGQFTILSKPRALLIDTASGFWKKEF